VTIWRTVCEIDHKARCGFLPLPVFENWSNILVWRIEVVNRGAADTPSVIARGR
jgi:hypothetical protein